MCVNQRENVTCEVCCPHPCKRSDYNKKCALQITDVAAFSAGPSSPHEDCLAEDAFVDDVRDGVLETERVNQARQEEIQWCRDLDVWEPVLEDMNTEGTKEVSLRWIDTNKAMKKPKFPLQLKSSAECHS